MDIKWALLLWFLKAITAQNLNCDFYQKLVPSQTYYIYSPNYPNNYAAGQLCRWIAQCPDEYKCQLECKKISLPKSPNCTEDQLLISMSGDVQLTGADKYCGQGSLPPAVSTGHKISIGLVTSKNSRGGQFICQVRTQCQCGKRRQVVVAYLRIPVTVEKLSKVLDTMACQAEEAPAAFDDTPTLTTFCGGLLSPSACQLILNPMAWRETMAKDQMSRIVGGEATGVNEYTMMAGLVDVRERSIKCGAVIISNQYVLTAAHCLKGQDTREIAVIVGEHDTEVDDSPATKVFRVANFIIHPQFNESNFDYDIAIIKVEGEIEFSDRVGPVCLPFKYANKTFTGNNVTVLGWGTKFIGGPKSKVLLKTDLKVLSQTECLFKKVSTTRRQMCTYTAGKDACQNDSGGPLLYTDPDSGQLYLAGIVSNGVSCAGEYPAVNTRVTELLRWIEDTTRHSYCRN